MKPIHLPLLAAVLSTLAPAAEPDRPGPGDPVPEVGVRDAEADRVQLREIVEGQLTVLVFYRGGWCPFCTRHLMALAEAKDDLAAAGYRIVAISPDRPAKIRETPDRKKLDYTLLSDSTMAAAKAFGIAFKVADELVKTYKTKHGIDLEAASGRDHHRLPHPSVYLVDHEGVIRFAHVDPDYKQRLAPDEILKVSRRVAHETRRSAE